MLSDDRAISVSNLGKTYRLFGHPGDRVKQFFSLGFKQYHREFMALQGISFDVKKGETVGVIGRNGSGKSTLLQLICGILTPTTGTVRVNGRISALLELGAGFNPEFTGRENVYFQAALMGMSQADMDKRYDDIAAFADIGGFIDEPVRTYSSGMFVRLAFSVAIHVDPEILVVDEALAVGDAGFQQKCFRRIQEIRDAGGSILLVTHAAEQVAHFCDRALLLDKGLLIADGDSISTLAHYVNLTQNPTNESVSSHTEPSASTEGKFHQHPAYNQAETRWGDRSATIEDIHIAQDGCLDPTSIRSGLAVELRLLVRFHADVEQPIYGLAIKSTEGAQLFGTNSRMLQSRAGISGQKAGDAIEVRFSFHPYLDAGDYLVSVGVVGESEAGLAVHDRRYDAIWLHVEHPLSPTEGIAMAPSLSICSAS